jgi:hypothetical protein
MWVRCAEPQAYVYSDLRSAEAEWVGSGNGSDLKRGSVEIEIEIDSKIMQRNEHCLFRCQFCMIS